MANSISRRETLLLLALGTTITACGSASGETEGFLLGHGSGEAATITNTVVKPSDMRVGDIFQLTFNGSDGADMSLDGAPTDARFVLAVMNLETSGAASQVAISSNVALAGAANLARAARVARADDASDNDANDESTTDVAANDAVSERSPHDPSRVDGAARTAESASAEHTDGDWDIDWSVQEAFEQNLRNLESRDAANAAAMVRGAEFSHSKAALGRESLEDASASTSAAYSMGSTEAFRVLGGLSAGTQYADVRGTVRCIAEHVVMYVDASLPKNYADFTDADLQAECARFDRQLTQEYRLFGEPSDINGDGRVAVLFTPQVNRIGAAGGGIVTGFFFASDLLPRSSSNPLSNEREIVYVLVPDARGVYGTPIGRDIALSNLIPAVLPHEVQHAISYNQHVFVNGGAPEQDWLNEGMSHLAEDVLGQGNENPSRYELYLQRTGQYAIVAPGAPGLIARGGIFLFLRYLYEQASAPEKFLWNIEHSSSVGVANLEQAYASNDPSFNQFAEFFLRFAITIGVNDLGITNDPRYSFEKREWGSGVYRGVCTECDANDNRGTVLEGVALGNYFSVKTLTMAPATAQYYEVGHGAKAVHLWARDATVFGAVLIRVQ